MAFTIPDKGTVVHDTQSILFKAYIDILVKGINGTECVISGCGVSVSTGLTVSITTGKVKSAGAAVAVTSGTVTLSAADTTYPRIDFIFIDTAGTITVRSGTSVSSAPKPPIKASTDVVLAAIYVPTGLTTLTASHIVDMRVLRSGGKHTVAIPAGALKPRVTGGCSSLATVAGATGQPDIPYLAFDPTTPQYAGIVIAMPKGWDEGTVTATFQWRRAANTAAGNVVWGMRALAVSDTDTPVANFGSEAVIIDAASTTLAQFNLSDVTAACTIGGTPVEGDLVFFEFFRKADDAVNDTLADAAWLTSVQLYYTADVDSDA
jgi:hypothetical protein